MRLMAGRAGRFCWNAGRKWRSLAWLGGRFNFSIFTRQVSTGNFQAIFNVLILYGRSQNPSPGKFENKQY
jgi:hypothetical protein